MPDGHRSATRRAYDSGASGWIERAGGPKRVELAAELRSKTEGTIVDLGCGPGWHLPALAPAVGLDLSTQMAQRAMAHAPVVQADLASLPFARESFGGAWASRSLVHLPRSHVPLALAEVHRILRVEARGVLWLFEGDEEHRRHARDPLPGRIFSEWPADMLRDTLVGAGFEIDELERHEVELASGAKEGQLLVQVTRRWTLPDYVGPDMRLLVCGLNPSPSSADSGVGFFKAGNRFWPAALRSGLVSRDRDPIHALREHGVGMTDMVKRATRRADELEAHEYRSGFERLERMVAWLRPQVVCMVGLSGWRAAVDRTAQRGWQATTVGGQPVYLMPSTSGLNAHDTVDSLTQHLAHAAAGP